MAVSTQPARPAESNMAQDHGVIPRLENGDRLTRAEFERRYDAMPELKKAELVEGEVYMPSPVRHGRHSHPHTRLVAWLANYETDTSGVEAGDNGSIRLDLDNESQPDAYLHRRPDSYRLERPSCRVGIAPTEDQHLFSRRTSVASLFPSLGPYLLAACGAPIPGSIRWGPLAEGRTSKSKIAVGM